MGLIEALGTLVGIALGAWLGGIFYKDTGDWLSSFMFGQKNVAYVVAFVLIYVVSSKAIGILFWFLNKIFKLIAIIPFLKTINRVAGATLGLIEAALMLGVILIFLSHFPFSSWLTAELAKSQIALWLMAIAKVLTPLLPKVLFLQ
ncbi:MAG: Colicin V production protein [Parcubacteria group bacterium GW2011_GWA2_38_13]|nr:MAG: Colicin V production protein [Parcubacteria group bacterium GW2011_GWA2_38_13]